MDADWSALIIDDDPGVRQSIRLCLEAAGGRVHQAGTSAGGIDALDRTRCDVVFLDLWLGSESGLNVLPEILRRQPGVSVIVVTAFATFETAVEAMKLGAVDYLPKPFTPDQVRTAARRVVTANVLKRRLNELQDRLDESEGDCSFETCSSQYSAFLQTVNRAAASDAVILLHGESGTGKTVLARWIRRQSRRPDAPFVTVHCPMLATDLMSSILFGHKKGAFTGAVTDSVGKIEEAEGGTLFLDEVADLSADAQSRLLRFLNDRTYERVGDAKEWRADVRLIAATNRSLEADVRSGRFREDLLFRLNVIPLHVPSLRDRCEDAISLARHYLEFFKRRQGRQHLDFSQTCERAIASYSWPGNLRELRNSVERASILCPSSVIEATDLGIQDSVAGNGLHDTERLVLGAEATLDEVEREHMAMVIAKSPSFEAAARTLGIDVTTLQRKRKKYGLS